MSIDLVCKYSQVNQYYLFALAFEEKVERWKKTWEMFENSKVGNENNFQFLY